MSSIPYQDTQSIETIILPSETLLQIYLNAGVNPTAIKQEPIGGEVNQRLSQTLTRLFHENGIELSGSPLPDGIEGTWTAYGIIQAHKAYRHNCVSSAYKEAELKRSDYSVFILFFRWIGINNPEIFALWGHTYGTDYLTR